MCAGNPSIFTLSVHAANNFPARKQQSTLDVPLPDGMGDVDYLKTVAEVRQSWLLFAITDCNGIARIIG